MPTQESGGVELKSVAVVLMGDRLQEGTVIHRADPRDLTQSNNEG